MNNDKVNNQNKGLIKLNKFIILNTLGLIAILAPQADAGNRKPAAIAPWKPALNRSQLYQQTNQSLLQNQKVRRQDGQNLNTFLINDELASQYRTAYQNLVTEQDEQKNRSLSNGRTKQEWADAYSNLSNQALNSIFDFQVQRTVRQAEKQSETLQELRKASQKASVAMQKITNPSIGEETQAPAASVNTSSVVKKSERSPAEVAPAPAVAAVPAESSAFDLNFKLGSKADVMGRRARVWMNQSLFDTSLDYVLDKPIALPTDDLPGMAQRLPQLTGLAPKGSLDWGNTETFRLNLSRGFDAIALRSTLSYGFTSTTVIASVTKDITQNLKAEVSHSRSVANATEAQEAKMLYQLHF